MLFKILKGSSERISTGITAFHEGYAYFTPDDGGFYIDAIVAGQNSRIRINPEYLKLSGDAAQGDYLRFDGENWIASPIESDDHSTTTISALLSASGWTNGEQTVTVVGLSAEQNGLIGMSMNASDAQISAIMNAQIRVVGQADGSITVRAEGEIPDTDIPVVVILLDAEEMYNTDIRVVLTASAWENGSQRIAAAGLGADQSGVLGMVSDMTDEQFNALALAKVYVSAQEEGYLTVSCSGVVPAIDIPVAIILVR